MPRFICSLIFPTPLFISWASNTLSRSINRIFTWVLTLLGLHLAANPSFSTLLNSHVLYSPNLQPPLTPFYSKHLLSQWPYPDDNQSHNRHPLIVLPIFFATFLTLFATLNTSNSYDQYKSELASYIGNVSILVGQKLLSQVLSHGLGSSLHVASAVWRHRRSLFLAVLTHILDPSSKHHYIPRTLIFPKVGQDWARGESLFQLLEILLTFLWPNKLYFLMG